MPVYVTAESRTYRSRTALAALCARTRTFFFHFLLDDVDVRRGRLGDIRAARRRVMHWDKAIKNQISLDCPSASASPLSLNHRSVPDVSLLSFLSAVRRFSLITALMFLVDQPQISFYLWLGLKNQRRKAENFQVEFPETWPLRVKVGEGIYKLSIVKILLCSTE